ncbi:serine acetyltransferase 1, chloroplastic-like [Humulus lupulus]|uniref:serine acetyltransferase 1, chloroplastic-like n=1 Tax=Humulus lupulus TaxID=3486 RepID=UPI002B416B80|nr:serine acetyltransferase 1, chloroplastic-like [Humulus lupulus]
MAACVENCRSQNSTIPFSLESNQCQLSNSLCKLVKLCIPTLPKSIPIKSVLWVGEKNPPTSNFLPLVRDEDDEEKVMWIQIQEEALSDVQQEPILHEYYTSSILSHNSLESSLSNLLAMKLSNSSISKTTLLETFYSVFIKEKEIRRAVRNDLKAVRERDPACTSYVHCLLNFKGFQASQAHRVAHKFWCQGRTAMATLIQIRVSEVFGVDIHPGAKIGSGLVIDHANGVVIGETAVVGENVTILHNVTLGGTGKVSGDRHPKIGDGVFIGAGSKVLGNVRIGEGARIGAGSVVLKNLPPNTTAVGNPARLIGV